MHKGLKLTLTSSAESFSQTVPASVATIGRSPTADFVVLRQEFSREHCLVELIGSELFITDLASKNGITLNSVRMEPNKRMKINDQMRIVIANILILSVSVEDIDKTARKIVNLINLSANTLESESSTLHLELDVVEKKSVKNKLPTNRRNIPKTSKEDFGARPDTSKLRRPLFMVISLAVAVIWVVSKYIIK